MSLLQRAVAADEALLLELSEAFCRVDQHPYEYEHRKQALAPLLADDRYGVVWLIGEPVIGYAVVTWGYSLESAGREGLLDEIYLAERGRGFGSAAVRAILDDLVQRGIRRMFLETEAHNGRVRRFYARNGFVEEDSIWMTWDYTGGG